MVDWSTRQLCLDDLNDKWNEAHDHQVDASVHIQVAWSLYNSIGTGLFRSIMNATLSSMQDIINALVDVIHLNFDVGEQYNLPYFLSEYTGGAADPITWEDIVAAWSESSVTGRLFTILSIDAMRKEIWNESVTSFELQKGADDW